MTNPSLSSDGSILSVHVPLNLRKRGGRKLIIAPAGTPEPVYSPARTTADPTLIKALARAHRWKKLLDTGKYATIKEIAETEGVAARYIGQLLQLTLLAPGIIEAALDGRLPKGVGLTEFMKPWPGVWEDQRTQLRGLEQGSGDAQK
jgi:hypothetical protein